MNVSGKAASGSTTFQSPGICGARSMLEGSTTSTLEGSSTSVNGSCVIIR